MVGPCWRKYKLAKCTGRSDWTVLQPLNFDFKSWDAPQHNSVAELSFPYLDSVVHVMMGSTMVPNDMCGMVVLKAIACATELDGSVMLDMNGKVATRNVHMFGVNLKWTRILQMQGEAGVITVRKDSKTGNYGAMMFIGYKKSENDSIKRGNLYTI